MHRQASTVERTQNLPLDWLSYEQKEAGGKNVSKIQKRVLKNGK